ncbi:hypothetical protein SAMN05216417_102123 [Nitrosospira multiformis]|uniref:Uncharacterized protein n=1 Tax=Nitrosospira multiformis TaxID=1231 RepID=A0A1I7FQR4_9PROT|nr:hypothetical protein SAMN05216417_102123 [Nitrosospira multiformis]
MFITRLCASHRNLEIGKSIPLQSGMADEMQRPDPKLEVWESCGISVELAARTGVCNGMVRYPGN